jgi:hypothetical protein
MMIEIGEKALRLECPRRRRRVAKRTPIETLILMLETGEAPTRRQAAFRLGKHANVAAIKPLCRALEDRNWGVRLYATRALGLIGSAKAVGPLRERLLDKTTRVRCEAVRALGVLGFPSVIEPICGMLADKKEKVRASAIASLVQVGLPSLPALCLRLTPEHLESGQALMALQEIVRVYGQSALQSLLGADALTPEQRWNALLLLSDFRNRFHYFSPERRLLADPHRICETEAESQDAAVRKGAREVLEYTTLARASQRSLSTEQGELLRGAQGSAAPQGGETLLRASAEVEAPEGKSPTLWARLRRRFTGK